MLALWTVADVTRERERHENVFQELQHAIDFLDHAPAGFFSADARGDIFYMNATLADWLDYDLAQVGSGGLALRRHRRRRRRRAAGVRARAAPASVRTEQFDLDLRRRNGQRLPVRLLHRVAFGAGRHARRLAHAGPQPLARRGTGREGLRAAEVRFARFFNQTPMAIATVDRAGRIVRSNAAFARLLPDALQGRGRPALDLRRRRRSATARRCARRMDARRAGSERHRAHRRRARRRRRPLRAAVRLARRGRRRRRGAIVYALDTTEQRTLRGAVRPVAEDAGGRPARRRRRARLQQRADRHHRLFRPAAGQSPADRPVLPGHHADQAERQPRGGAGAAAAGLLAPPDAAPAGAAARRRAVRPADAAAAAGRREDRARTSSTAATSGW